MRHRLKPELIGVYGHVWHVRKPLFRLSVVWLGLAMLGLYITGRADMVSVSLDGSLSQTLGSLIHLFAVLAGWYCAHRFLLDPRQKVDYLPSPLQAKFIGTQALLIISLSLVTGLILAPFTLLFMPPLDATLPPEQIQAQAAAASRQFAPLVFALMLWLFSRLILVAPLLVRDAPQAVRASWRATKGHWLRLFALQMGVLLPMIVGSLVALALAKVLPVFGMFFSTVGLFISLLLYTQLAETEFKALLKETSHV